MQPGSHTHIFASKVASLPYTSLSKGQDGVSLSEAERLVSTVSCPSDTTRTVKRLGRCHLFVVPPRGKLPQDDAAVYLFGTHWIKGIQSLVNFEEDLPLFSLNFGVITLFPKIK